MGRRNAVVAALALVPLLLAFRPGLMGGSGPQTSSGGSSGGGGAAVEYDQPSSNVFNTYNPNCNPDDVATLGTTFCDGHEDGVWIQSGCTNDEGDLNCDYYRWSDSGGASTIPDPANGVVTNANDYTMCNSGTIDPDVADFGAAGTPCTASKGWVDVAVDVEKIGGTVDGAHRMVVNGNATTFPAVGLVHFSYRVYVKFAGVTSQRCPSPPCSGFHLLGSNGYKAIEIGSINDVGGTYAPLLQTWYGGNPETLDATLQMFGVTPVNGCSTYGTECEAANCTTAYVSQDTTVDRVDHRDYLDEWIAIEVEMNLIDTNGFIRVWMNACGKNGLGCSSGDTQTLVAEVTGKDLNNTCTSTNEMRNIWVNFWSKGQRGEIQWDELEVRDRSVNDSNIGWMDNVTP